MFYQHHHLHHYIGFFHSQSVDWATWVTGIANFLAVLFVGGLATFVALRQIKIQDFVEIFIRPVQLPDKSWQFQLRNISSRIIYITKIESIDIDPNALKISRDGKLSLATGENNYYSIGAPLNPEKCKVPREIRFNIEFQDHLGEKKYRSHHVVWFQNDSWGAQNLKAERV